MICRFTNVREARLAMPVAPLAYFGLGTLGFWPLGALGLPWATVFAGETDGTCPSGADLPIGIRLAHLLSSCLSDADLPTGPHVSIVIAYAT